MKKNNLLIRCVDLAVVLYYVFLLALQLVSFFKIGDCLPPEALILIGIANTVIWQTVFGYLIYLIPVNEVFESFQKLYLNERFRLYIIIQIVFGLVLFQDSFIHPSIYDFAKKPFSKSYIKDIPFYIWLLGVFFKRIMTIEKKLEEINNKF